MSMALDLDPLNGEIWFEKGKLAEQLGDGAVPVIVTRKPSSMAFMKQVNSLISTVIKSDGAGKQQGEQTQTTDSVT